MARSLDIDMLVLEAGTHPPGERYCVMEAVAYLAGENWTEAPACAGPVLGAFCRALNDVSEPYGTENRERLRGYIPALLGAARSPDGERLRSLMALDWLIRTYLPAWLRLVPALGAHADRLSALPVLTVPGTDYVAVGDLVRAALVAARAAAWDTAWDAAGDAARVAAGAAALVAVWDAALVAALVAAGDAAWDAAWDTAWDAAGDAARVAAGAAALVAAGDAAGDAAGAAARDALAPIVAALRASAWDLLDRMIALREGGAS